jgi:ABC-type glutathione transport system ATPase component
MRETMTTDVDESVEAVAREPRESRDDRAAGDSLIHARGLTKRFGEFTAVDGVDFDVQPGEAFGFLGPNGAGKTSTMRMIGCTSPISDGTLSVLGMDPRRDRLFEERDAAAGRPDEGQQHPDRRGLAGAIRAEEAVDAARGHPQVEARHGLDVLELLDEALRRDDRRGRMCGRVRRRGAAHAARNPRYERREPAS